MIRFDWHKDETEWNDVPDEFLLSNEINGKNTKIFKTKAVIYRYGHDTNLTIQLSGLVPVFSNNIKIGCVGNIEAQGQNIVAELIIDNQTPERFDIENGNKMWAWGYFTPVINDSMLLMQVNLSNENLSGTPPVGTLVF